MREIERDWEGEIEERREKKGKDKLCVIEGLGSEDFNDYCPFLEKNELNHVFFGSLIYLIKHSK